MDFVYLETPLVFVRHADPAIAPMIQLGCHSKAKRPRSITGLQLRQIPLMFGHHRSDMQ
jgi:hypothetical protein